MIKHIELINFQGHKSSSLEFSPGVNVILGSSDSGKSSIFRALLWVLTNRPSGSAFRRTSSKLTSVTVESDKGKVTRKKSDTKNLYAVVETGKDRLVLKAFGQDLPADIHHILPIDTFFSIQHQADPHFLLSSNSSEVGKVFNKVARVQLIDSSIRYVGRILKNARVFEKFSQSERARLTAKTQRLEGVDKLVLSSGEIALMREKESDLSSQVKELKALIESCTDARMIFCCGSALDSLERLKKELDNFIKVRLAKIEDQLSVLKDLLKLYEDNKIVLQKSEDELKRTNVCPYCQKPI
jgi:DNA repair exonuclease SbcCD ATPase subunit